MNLAHENTKCDNVSFFLMEEKKYKEKSLKTQIKKVDMKVDSLFSGLENDTRVASLPSHVLSSTHYHCQTRKQPLLILRLC